MPSFEARELSWLCFFNEIPAADLIGTTFLDWLVGGLEHFLFLPLMVPILMIIH